MKNYLSNEFLREVIRMSRFILLIVSLQVLTVSLLLGAESKAQGKSIYEIEIHLTFEDAPLINVFNLIETKTDFNFSYHSEIVDQDQLISVHNTSSFGKLLESISQQTNLKFRRIDNNIHVYEKTAGEEAVEEDRSDGQDYKVTGTVTDENGEGLPGATVVVKNRSIGTITNANGNYSIEVPEGDQTLVFSFVGYKSREVPVSSNTVVDVSLEPDISNLQEVVVIGYGEVEKRDVTGSVAQVKSEELEAVPVYNVEQALKARAAGVRVTQNSGQPGGRIEVRVRGGNSMIGNNQPLYVVDGFPVTGGINFLNPADIESIDILKDASATAIYGARGANGVVIITSKRGKAGQESRIEVNSYYGVQHETNRYDLLDAREYAQIANEWLKNEGQEPFFNLEEIDGTGTDWQDAVLRSAPLQNHTISFSGSSRKTRYAVSGNYYDQDGILINTGVKRGSMRLNLDHEIKDWLKMAVNLNLSRRQQRSVPVNNGYRGTGSVLSAAASAPPTLSVYDQEGLPTQIETFYNFGSADMRNPMIFAGQQTTTLANTVIGNTSFEIQLAKGLSFKTLLGIEYANSLVDFYAPVIFENDRGSARQENTYRSSFLNENVLIYTRKLGSDHNITLTGGYTYQTNMNRYSGIGVSGFSNNTTKNFDLSAAETIGTPWSGISEWVLASWLARANYSFKEKYLFTVSMRSDGSSRFGENNKWAVFPSAALAWRISEEPFLANLGAVSDMKLRTSYGVTGNTALSPYQSLDRMESLQTIYGDHQEAIGFSPAGISNPDLKWETTEQIDIGLDLGVWDNRIRFTVDYYQKKTSDLLASVPLPPSVGFGSILQNIGEIENTGFEFTLSGDIITSSNLSWDVSGSFSTNKNEVLKIAGGSDILSAGQAAVWSSTNIAREGEPLGSLYGYLEDGLDEEGFIRYKDINGDGEVNAQDRVILGNPNPDFFYGFNSNLTYKNFELNIFLEGVYGNEIFNATDGTHLNSFQRGNNQFEDITGNYWTSENPDPNAEYPKISSATSIDISDRFIEDGSYLRVKSIRFSYNLPLAQWGVTWANFAQVYFSGINLFTFTDYSGLDPEVNTRGDDTQNINTRLQMGHDQSGYPNAKTYAVGLKFNF